MTGPADRARQALASGLPPAEVYAALAVGAGLRDTALAVCDALGTPRADAEHRLRGTEELWGDFAPGDEELVGELLDLAAVFESPQARRAEGQHHRADGRDEYGTYSGAPAPRRGAAAGTAGRTGLRRQGLKAR
ncbi:hypothetical protein ACWGQT_07570 [Streptomyces yangpuensis]